MFEGTTAFWWTGRWTWPKVHTLWRSFQVADGDVTFWAGPDQCFTCVFRPERQSTFWVTTCPVLFASDEAEFHTVATWREREGNLYLNGQLIASTRAGAEPPEKFVIESYRHALGAADFTAENEQCMKARTVEVAGLPLGRDRSALPLDMALQQLQAAIDQLEHLVSEIRNGRSFLDTALSARLRALICRFANKRSYPLLQRIAGLNSLPLIVYALPFDGIRDESPQANGLSISILGAVCTEALTPVYTALDIDIWLQLRHVRVEGLDYSNNELLRSIADTTGSHYDTGVGPLVSSLEKVGRTGQGLSLLTEMLIETGRTVTSLGRGVLEAVQTR